MNKDTVITYENEIGKIVFSFDSPFWVTELDASSVDVGLGEVKSYGQTGSTITSQSISPKSFSLDGCIFDPVEENRERLIKVIAPKVSSRLTVTKDHKSYYLAVVPSRTPTVSGGVGVQEFQCQLMAAYPLWRDTDERSAQIAGLTDLFKFPLVIEGSWHLSKYSGDSMFASVINSGNIATEMTVSIYAAARVVDPEIYSVHKRRYIRIQKTMEVGERIEISTELGKKGVVVYHPGGEVENGFKYLDITSDLSLTLDPGENLIRCDAGENREGMRVSITSPRGVISGV